MVLLHAVWVLLHAASLVLLHVVWVLLHAVPRGLLHAILTVLHHTVTLIRKCLGKKVYASGNKERRLFNSVLGVSVP